MQSGVLKALITIAAYFLAQSSPGSAPSPPSGTNRTISRRAVVAYYSEYYPGERRPYEALRAQAGCLTAIAPFAYYLDGEGNISGSHPEKAIAAAKAGGVKVLALLHNFSRGRGFETQTAHRLLSNPAARGRAVGKILALVRSKGYDGINLDLENVPAWDRANYTAFVRELASALRPLGYLVTASVPAKVRDERNSPWSGAFDYAALAPWLDQVMLMTYDEYTPSGKPGPVASLPWVEQVVRYAKSLIPGRKILIGLAGYGYEWVDGRTGGAKAREFPEIQALVDRLGLTPRWDSARKVPYLVYRADGTRKVLWYENSWSAAYKLELVERYDLGGVALWRLGAEDPRLWSVIRAKFGLA
ncbi:MAG: chitinase [Firmicutes bacterium]|nr:chitinase [Bacillota bacterium]